MQAYYNFMERADAWFDRHPEYMVVFMLVVFFLLLAHRLMVTKNRDY